MYAVGAAVPAPAPEDPGLEEREEWCERECELGVLESECPCPCVRECVCVCGRVQRGVRVQGWWRAEVQEWEWW